MQGDGGILKMQDDGERGAYAAPHPAIRSEEVGAGFAQHPSGRTESCTLRILWMRFRCSRREGGVRRGDEDAAG